MALAISYLGLIDPRTGAEYTTDADATTASRLTTTSYRTATAPTSYDSMTAEQPVASEPIVTTTTSADSFSQGTIQPSPYPPLATDAAAIPSSPSTMAPYTEPVSTEPAPLPQPVPMPPSSIPIPQTPPPPLPAPVEPAATDQPSAGPRIEPDVPSQVVPVPAPPPAVVGLSPTGKWAIGIGLLLAAGLTAGAIARSRRR